jgi:hypothetical protein
LPRAARVPRKPRKYPLGQSRRGQTLGKRAPCVALVKFREKTPDTPGRARCRRTRETCP